MIPVRELLPIGSVVRAKNGTKKIMIIGVKQTQLQNKGTPEEHMEDFDYIAVIYPEGSMGENTQFLLNHSDIEEICFRGMEDEERDSFIQRLSVYYGESQNEDELDVPDAIESF